MPHNTELCHVPRTILCAGDTKVKRPLPALDLPPHSYEEQCLGRECMGTIPYAGCSTWGRLRIVRDLRGAPEPCLPRPRALRSCPDGLLALWPLRCLRSLSPCLVPKRTLGLRCTKSCPVLQLTRRPPRRRVCTAGSALLGAGPPTPSPRADWGWAPGDWAPRSLCTLLLRRRAQWKRRRANHNPPQTVLGLGFWMGPPFIFAN